MSGETMSYEEFIEEYNFFVSIGMTKEEVAKSLGMSVEAVEKRFYRATASKKRKIHG